MSDIDDVLATNQSFYSAFRDFNKMNGLWLSDISFCLHPGQEPIYDRGAIMNSWKEIIATEQLDIAPANERVVWFADTALVICEEIIAEKPSNVVMIASNLFIRYNYSSWCIAGHHAGRKS